MLELPQIDAIASDIVRSFLPPGASARAQSYLHAGIDSDDELQVMFVVEDSGFDHLMRNNPLELLMSLQDHLRAGGDDRFASIRFSTEEELAADGGA